MQVYNYNTNRYEVVELPVVDLTVKERIQKSIIRMTTTQIKIEMSMAKALRIDRKDIHRGYCDDCGLPYRSLGVCTSCGELCTQSI